MPAIPSRPRESQPGRQPELSEGPKPTPAHSASAALTTPLKPPSTSPQLPPAHQVQHAASGLARNTLGFIGDQIGGAGKKIAGAGLALSQGLHSLRGDVLSWENPAAVTPPDRGGLKLASYNIYMGRKDFAAICSELKQFAADVICLQEANLDCSRRLAEQLGMHLVFHEAESGITRTVGKAILSKYPIVAHENLTYADAWTDRIKVAVGGKKFEALEDRSLLRATLEIGSRNIDIIDTHLSLSNPDANAAQIQQLADYVVARRATGASVLVAGDFNSNLALTGGAQDAPGQLQTPTDTLAEYLDRYQRHPGNIAHANDAAAVRRLSSLLQSHWQAPERSVRNASGVLSPEDALKELPQTKKGSERHRELLYALDGVTHGGAAKRFDNLFASRDLELVSSLVDQRATGSDHWPVLMEVRWGEARESGVGPFDYAQGP